MKIDTKVCLHCGEPGQLELSGEQYTQLLTWDADGQVTHIQEGLDTWPKEMREQFLTGTHGQCWIELFASEDEGEMTLDIRKFTQKPFYVDAVQVTADNMAAVAEWCDGKVCTPEMPDEAPYVKVSVIRPTHLRQTQAFERDWVLRTESGFKVYNPKAFNRSFTETVEPEGESDPEVLSRAEAIFAEPS